MAARLPVLVLIAWLLVGQMHAINQRDSLTDLLPLLAGDDYLDEALRFSQAHIWRNFGILVG